MKHPRVVTHSKPGKQGKQVTVNGGIVFSGGGRVQILVPNFATNCAESGAGNSSPHQLPR
jgi:hypothetical protein